MHEQIKNDLKEAMREKNLVRKDVLRSVLTAFTNELIAFGDKPDGELSDEKAQTVVARLAKQRRDAISQFENGGREDLAKAEQAELDILEEYLPEQMTEDDIRKFVETKKEDLGITEANQKGQLMGAVMKDLKGKADGKVVKDVIDESFSTE